MELLIGVFHMVVHILVLQNHSQEQQIQTATVHTRQILVMCVQLTLKSRDEGLIQKCCQFIRVISRHRLGQQIAYRIYGKFPELVLEQSFRTEYSKLDCRQMLEFQSAPDWSPEIAQEGL